MCADVEIRDVQMRKKAGKAKPACLTRGFSAALPGRDTRAGNNVLNPQGDRNLQRLAEREGFEPPIRLPVCRISSAVHSTTQPPLRGEQRGGASLHLRRSAR